MKESPINILSDILDVNDSELTLRTFVESPEYLGSSSIYEWWKENMEGWPDDINEVIATGSLGGGKSYVVGAIYVIYRLVKLFQRGDLCKMFDLAPNTDIYIIYFSLSITLAKRTGFQYLFEVVDQCKWLREHYPRNQRLTSEIEFPNHVHIIYASAEGHQTGLNVLMFILDEANFRKGVGLGMEDEYAEVQQLAIQLEDRQLSRFLVDGKLQSLAVYISSASYQSSFIDKKIEEAEGVETSRVITCVKYKVTPEKYSKEKFEVFVGYGQIEPCIVETPQQKSGLIALTGLDPELCEKLFEWVPVTLLPQFKKNIYLALQNHCGRSTSVKGSFFTNVSLLKESYTMDEPNPFVQDSVIISNKSSLLIQDAFDVNRLDTTKVDLPHSLFLDLSLQGDQGSITCVRYDGMRDRVRYHSHLFTVSIIPPEYPAMTDIDKITEFVLWLSEILNIVAFGSDQYQCLGPGTLIPTTNGIKRIEEVHVGDKLFCKEGLCSVKNVFRYENAETVDLITKRGHHVNCTPNHRFSYIKRTERNGGGYHYPERCGLLYATEMLGKRIDSAHGFMIDGEQQELYGVKVDPDFAEYIGWMTGDGGISNGRPYLCASPEEKDIILTLERRLHNREVPNYWYKSKPSYNLPLISGKHKTALLKFYGNRYSSKDKCVPDFIYKSPKDVVDAFLRGLYSSDGSCTKEQVVLTSVSYDLLSGVQVLLDVHYGIKTQITAGKRGYDYDFVNASSVYHLRTVGSTRRFIEIGFWQDSKLNNLCKTFSVVGKGFADYVVDIVPSKNRVVYDLEVDSSDHTYYLWDMLTHNSSQIRQHVNKVLGLDDIRLSLDSSDVPFTHWVAALVAHRFRQRYYQRQEKEILEAQHDLKRRRIIKRPNSSDDQFQTLVGAYYLSDTVAAAQWDEGINLFPEGRANLIGGKSISQVLRQLGYDTLK